MPPKTRANRGSGGSVPPMTPAELAELIAQQVNTALEQRDANHVPLSGGENPSGSSGMVGRSSTGRDNL